MVGYCTVYRKEDEVAVLIAIDTYRLIEKMQQDALPITVILPGAAGAAPDVMTVDMVKMMNKSDETIVVDSGAAIHLVKSPAVLQGFVKSKRNLVIYTVNGESCLLSIL